MPQRRKTRSSGLKEAPPVSPTSNGGRTHPKEMYAPDRATRSRTSSSELVIMELPINSRGKKHNNQATDDVKSKRVASPTDRMNASSVGKQSNDVNNSMSSPRNEDEGGTRTRRRSGRVSGESSSEKEPRRSSPQVVTSSRSERRRRRSSTESESPPSTTTEASKIVGKSNRLRRRSSTSSEDRSPLGRQDNSRQTNKKNKRLDHGDDDEGNFKIPSEPVDVVSLHESPRPGRRQGPSGKTSGNIDTVLSVDVTSQDSLPIRTSPRRPKLSPRSDRTSQTNAAASKDTLREGDVDTNDDASHSMGVLDEEDDKETTNSSRKRHASNESAESDGAGRKRRKTGSVCRDLTSQFVVPEETDEHSEPCDEEHLSVSMDNNGDEQPDVLNAVNLERVQDNGSVSPGAKSCRKGGSSTPTNSPRKSLLKSPTKSPRRGLRSGGDVPTPSTDVLISKEQNQTDVPLDDGDETGTVKTTSVMEEKRTDNDDVSSVAMDDIQQDDDKIEIEDYEEFSGDGWYEEVEDTELFYFESDHLALKGNRDYRMMLRTLTTLEAQRKQAVQDLDILVDKKRESLRDPVLFAQKLQKREDVGLPTPQKVVVLPDIEWEKYLGAAEAIEIAGFKHQTRGAKTSKKIVINKPSSSIAGPSATSAISSAISTVHQKPTTSSQQPSTSVISDTLLDSSERREQVRGRLPDPNKPASFNQLWTIEEQRKLEDLLVKFPMEEVEARRWEKVARALGNRTSQQVASRVQKYFIKLTKAGLPVPGRIPNMTYYTNRRVGMGMRGDRRMNPFTKPLYQPSTFLQSIRPPVYMTDEDEHNGWSGCMGDSMDTEEEMISDDESIPVELRDSEEYHELLRLKRIKKERLRQQTLMSHPGFKCDGCNMEPIMGIRWHCVDCPNDVSTDLCQECVDCDFNSSHHSSNHQMDPIQYNHSSASGPSMGGPSFVDMDYTRFTPSTGDYNYLDPNYMPT